jgi:hypothetical protein
MEGAQVSFLWRFKQRTGGFIIRNQWRLIMHSYLKAAAAGLLSMVLSPAFAQSLDDYIAHATGEPALPPAAEKMTDQGFADHSRVNAAKAGKHSITFVEEGPNDTGVSLSMDPLSGEIAPVKSH